MSSDGSSSTLSSNPEFQALQASAGHAVQLAQKKPPSLIDTLEALTKIEECIPRYLQMGKLAKSSGDRASASVVAKSVQSLMGWMQVLQQRRARLLGGGGGGGGAQGGGGNRELKGLLGIPMIDASSSASGGGSSAGQGDTSEAGLARRLAALKGEDDASLQRRLAKLNPGSYSASSASTGGGLGGNRNPPVDDCHMSEESQVRSLLTQVNDAARLDGDDSDLVARFAKLHEGTDTPSVSQLAQTASGQQQLPEEDHRDEDARVNDLMRQVCDAVALEKETGIVLSDSSDDSDEEKSKKKKKGAGTDPRTQAYRSEAEEREAAIRRMKQKKRMEEEKIRRQLGRPSQQPRQRRGRGLFGGLFGRKKRRQTVEDDDLLSDESDDSSDGMY